eukprot:7488738-Karenia_brevis.AAC.1
MLKSVVELQDAIHGLDEKAFKPTDGANDVMVTQLVPSQVAHTTKKSKFCKPPLITITNTNTVPLQDDDQHDAKDMKDT